MAEVVALVTADWHVRKFDRVWYRRDTLCGDTEWGIKQIRDIVHERSIKCVLLLGDLFEQKLQQSDALRVMRVALDDLERQRCNVWYVQGQHERSSPPLLSAIHDWPRHLDGVIEILPGNDMLVYGLDYVPPTDVEEALKRVPDADILATHQVWKDLMGSERGDAWLHWAGHVPYVLTGDYHRTLYEQRGQQSIMSPGSLCMQSIDEVPDKHVYLLRDDMSAEPVRLKSRGYFGARLYSEDDLIQFLDTWHQNPARIPQQEVPHSIATNILRVWYRADIPDAKQRIEARVQLDAHLFMKVIPVEDTQITVDAERRAQAILNGGLEGCIRTFYADNPVVCEDAVRLARTRDIQEELLQIYKERLNGTDRQREGTLQNTTT